ncbi:MAG: Gfo/Idh/MocA family oxidoreductase [Bacteroidota bacterium]|nr:Gfo/Idh/MocA family oxidoreductase [Bacteroidota bacterium]
MFLKYDKVKWGIIGCGDVTEVKSGPAFYKSDNSELIAVMRRDVIKAKDYAKRHNVKKYYSDADSLINDNEINAIYIATPPSSHAEYAIKAMKVGKAVYVEKPMALNYLQAKEMIRVSREQNVALFVAYYRRLLEYFIKVKELLESGVLGKITQFHLNLTKPLKTEKYLNKKPWRVIPEISGGGYFYDLGSHQIDILDFLFGKAKTVKGKAVNNSKLYEAEDTVSAFFEFENDIIGTANWNFGSVASVNVDFMKIIGTKGKIEFSFFSFNPIILTTDKGKEKYYYKRPKHIQQNMVQDIVNMLTGKIDLNDNAISGLRTSMILEEITASFKKSNVVE